MNVLTIAGRELRSYFHTTIGWLVLAGFLVLTGIFWSTMVSFYVMQSEEMLASPYGMEGLNLTDYLLSPFFGNLAVVFMMVCPAIAMRLFSDELKSRTMELLFTSPLATAEIVLGKYLGAMGFIAVMLLGTAYVPLTLWAYAAPDWGAVLGGYLALYLVSGILVAIGMLFSSMTPNAVVALIGGFAGSLVLLLLTWFQEGPEHWTTHLSIVTHMEELVRGVVRLSDLTYFLAFIGFLLFATHQRVEGYRWR